MLSCYKACLMTRVFVYRLTKYIRKKMSSPSKMPEYSDLLSHSDDIDKGRTSIEELSFDAPIPQRRSSLGRIRLVIAIITGTLIFILGFRIGIYSHGRKHFLGFKDRRALIPNFPHKHVVFEPDYRFFNLTSPESVQTWADFVHHGHLVVERPSDYGLPPGIPVSPHADRMIMTGFHQIHCLRVLRESFYTMLTGKRVEGGPHPYQAHPDHCFDYLRQTITCRMDFTMEGSYMDDDGKRRATNGWGTTHKCVDWNAVEGWMMDTFHWEKSHKDWKVAYDSEPLPPEPLDPVPHCTWPDKKGFGSAE